MRSSGEVVASHLRSGVRHRHTTIPEHMPSAHRRYAEWTPQRMMREAASIGSATIALVEAIMKAKPHPEQGFGSCLGIMHLVKTYGSERVEAASRRGNISAPPLTARSSRSCRMGSIKPTPTRKCRTARRPSNKRSEHGK
jgi:hypothetical protein